MALSSGFELNRVFFRASDDTHGAELWATGRHPGRLFFRVALG